MSCHRLFTFLIAAALVLGVGSAQQVRAQPASSSGEKAAQQRNAPPPPVRGWNILSDDTTQAEETIRAASQYGINHLQLSHEIVMDLRHVRVPERRGLARHLTRRAHEDGIEEVVLWDHALYDLDYYPDRFKTGPDSTLDLDDPAFWKWLKGDYRDMLETVPEIDGLVLTFIETGAHVEDQHSEKLKTDAEKLAAVVNAVANVVVREHGLSLYLRTFMYTQQELDAILKMLELIEYEEGVTVMVKEVPHDFFLTHPVNEYVGEIDRPTIIEFDAAGEYNGQGVIATTFVEMILKRWRYYQKQDNVVGYVARTDRYGDTSIIGKSGEIMLYALKRAAEESSVKAETIYDGFITETYGADALPYLKPAFKKAYDIVTSTFYTLGLNTVSHSRLNFDYSSIYTRHVSGRWTEEPQVRIGHGVDTTFHYWKDVVEHLSPARHKRSEGRLQFEAPEVVEQGWVTPSEKMNWKYLGYVIEEKNYGVEQAREALNLIRKAEPHVSAPDYEVLYHTFERTLLTARVRRAAAQAYYGYRLWTRGERYQTAELRRTIWKGLREMKAVAGEIRSYDGPVPAGEWDWREDAERAMRYYRRIAETGWDQYGGAVVEAPSE